MTELDARKLVMNTSRTAMREYDEQHRGEEINIDDRLAYINGFVAATLPAEVRKLAV